MAEKPSEINPKSTVVSPITPILDTDTYPSHYSDFGFGGLRTVATVVERNAITFARQVVGMLAYVEADDTYWKLLSTGNPLTDSNWEPLQVSGGGAALKVVAFNNRLTTDMAGSWVDQTDGTETVDLEHNLNVAVLNVKFYQDGVDGSVFVPWEIVNSNTIRGCVPANSRFSGLVHITSSVQSGGSGDGSFPFEFTNEVGVSAGWRELPTDSTKIFHEVTHALGTSRPGVEIYDSTSQEVLLDIRRDSTTTITLIIDAGEQFAGYGYIRG